MVRVEFYSNMGHPLGAIEEKKQVAENSLSSIHDPSGSKEVVVKVGSAKPRRLRYHPQHAMAMAGSGMDGGFLQALIPILTSVAGAVASKAVPWLMEKIKDYQRQNQPLLDTLSKGFKATKDEIITLNTGVQNNTTTLQAELQNNTAALQAEIARVLAAINLQLPELQQLNTVSQAQVSAIDDVVYELKQMSTKADDQDDLRMILLALDGIQQQIKQSGLPSSSSSFTAVVPPPQYSSQPATPFVPQPRQPLTPAKTPAVPHKPISGSPGSPSAPSLPPSTPAASTPLTPSVSGTLKNIPLAKATKVPNRYQLGHLELDFPDFLGDYLAITDTHNHTKQTPLTPGLDKLFSLPEAAFDKTNLPTLDLSMVSPQDKNIYTTLMRDAGIFDQVKHSERVRYALGKTKTLAGHGLQYYHSSNDLGSISAKNSSKELRNEGMEIIDLLLKKGEMTKAQHKELFDLLKVRK